MARQLEVTWGDRMREEGRQEGHQEGAVLGKRDAVLMVLRSRFVSVPEDLTRRIEAIASLEELDRLLGRSATAASLDDVRAAVPN